MPFATADACSLAFSSNLEPGYCLKSCADRKPAKTKITQTVFTQNNRNCIQVPPGGFSWRVLIQAAGGTLTPGRNEFRPSASPSEKWERGCLPTTGRNLC